MLLLGLLKVRVIPPRKLYLPVLPIRLPNGSLIYFICCFILLYRSTFIILLMSLVKFKLAKLKIMINF